VFFNQGAGRFSRLAATLPQNQSGRLLAVGDFNADGGPELLYYQYGGSSTEKVYIINAFNLSFKKP
jgi:hypothetical protein